MIIIKKIALSIFLSLAVVAVAPVALAEDTAAISTGNQAATVIAHIEQGLAEVQKSDFSAAYLHLKAARTASDSIQGNEAIVKQGLEGIIQGQINVKTGDVAKASAELNKALTLYKSLK